MHHTEDDTAASQLQREMDCREATSANSYNIRLGINRSCVAPSKPTVNLHKLKAASDEAAQIKWAIDCRKMMDEHARIIQYGDNRSCASTTQGARLSASNANNYIGHDDNRSCVEPSMDSDILQRAVDTIDIDFTPLSQPMYTELPHTPAISGQSLNSTGNSMDKVHEDILIDEAVSLLEYAFPNINNNETVANEIPAVAVSTIAVDELQRTLATITGDVHTASTTPNRMFDLRGNFNKVLAFSGGGNRSYPNAFGSMVEGIARLKGGRHHIPAVLFCTDRATGETYCVVSSVGEATRLIEAHVENQTMLAMGPENRAHRMRQNGRNTAMVVVESTAGNTKVADFVKALPDALPTPLLHIEDAAGESKQATWVMALICAYKPEENNYPHGVRIRTEDETVRACAFMPFLVNKKMKVTQALVAEQDGNAAQQMTRDLSSLNVLNEATTKTYSFKKAEKRTFACITKLNSVFPMVGCLNGCLTESADSEGVKSTATSIVSLGKDDARIFTKYGLSLFGRFVARAVQSAPAYTEWPTVLNVLNVTNAIQEKRVSVSRISKRKIALEKAISDHDVGTTTTTRGLAEDQAKIMNLVGSNRFLDGLIKDLQHTKAALQTTQAELAKLKETFESAIARLLNDRDLEHAEFRKERAEERAEFKKERAEFTSTLAAEREESKVEFTRMYEVVSELMGRVNNAKKTKKRKIANCENIALKRQKLRL